jgi:hypothetical protein
MSAWVSIVVYPVGDYMITEEYCLWQGVGNGYYATECGELLKDKGRFNQMLNDVYQESNTDLKRIKTCPKCKKVTITYEEVMELKEKFGELPDANK